VKRIEAGGNETNLSAKVRTVKEEKNMFDSRDQNNQNNADYQTQIDLLKNNISRLTETLEREGVKIPGRTIIGYGYATNYCDPEPIYGDEESTGPNYF